MCLPAFPTGNGDADGTAFVCAMADTVRRLIIGDIHGCYQELLQLVEQAGLAAGDEIISLGDLVDRGPDSPAVLDFFQTRPGAMALMGNHERKHMRWLAGEVRPALSQRLTRQQFGEARYPAACAALAALPLYRVLPEAILVHGFLEPGVPLTAQRDSVLVGAMSGEHFLSRKLVGIPWYERYDGALPVIVGHRNYLGTREPLIYRDRVYGLDTGCCDGLALTGLLLPEFRLLSVPASEDHWSVARRRQAQLRPPRAARPLTWREAERVISQAASAPQDSSLQEQAQAAHTLLATAEGQLAALCQHLLAESRRLLAELQQQGEFAALSSREQGVRFAEYIGRTPAASLLHLARRGQLMPETLRRRLAGPAAVLRLAQEVGLSDSAGAAAS